MIEAKFSIDLIVDSQAHTFGEDVVGAIKENLALLNPQDGVGGSIEISVPGQEQLVVSDELWAAVQNLCFECTTALFDEKQESYLYRITEYEGEIVLIPSGNMIRIVRDDAAVLTAPADELFAALYACGKRFIGFLKSIEGSNGPTVGYLEPFAERARLSLLRRGVEIV